MRPAFLRSYKICVLGPLAFRCFHYLYSQISPSTWDSLSAGKRNCKGVPTATENLHCYLWATSRIIHIVELCTMCGNNQYFDLPLVVCLCLTKLLPNLGYQLQVQTPLPWMYMLSWQCIITPLRNYGRWVASSELSYNWGVKILCIDYHNVIWADQHMVMC